MSVRQLARALEAVFAIFVAAAATGAAAQTYIQPFTITSAGGTTGSGTLVMNNSTLAPGTSIINNSSVSPLLVSATINITTINGGVTSTTFSRSDLSGSISPEMERGSYRISTSGRRPPTAVVIRCSAPRLSPIRWAVRRPPP